MAATESSMIYNQAFKINQKTQKLKALFAVLFLSLVTSVQSVSAQQSLNSTANGGASNSVQGPGSTATNDGATAIGVFATASGDRSVAVGPATAGGQYSVAVGNGAAAQGQYELSTGTFAGTANVGSDYNTAVGAFTGNNITGERNSSFGYAAGQATTGARNTALGANAGQLVTGERNLNGGISSGFSATGDRNVGLGAQAGQYMTGNNNVAIGNIAGSGTPGATLFVNSAVSIGNSAQASADNSVALGANSLANQVNTVSIGSVGNERRLVNVAAGVAQTDGVNVSQLLGHSSQTLIQANSYTDVQVAGGIQQASSFTNQRFAQSISYTDARANQLNDRINAVQKSANQGIAAAVAMLSTIRTPSPGKSTINLGGGYYGGQAAAALSMAHRSRDSRLQATMALGIPVSIANGANLAAAIGLGFEF
ncbi:MAG: YadA-like family protein [Candidatus Melainabacteria bacterium]|nr:YadA-like family protein [Candidatus Melainabacteria bacterium]